MITRLSQRLRSACILIFMFVMACLALPRLASANTAPKSLGSLTPASIVKIRENGFLHDFIVIKHGYPTSDNGRTLLLRKNIVDSQKWNSVELVEEGPGYSASTIDAWLTSTYYSYLDTYTRGEVTEVSIKSRVGAQNPNNTINRKVFLLADGEVFNVAMISPIYEGSYLSFFNSPNSQTRKAYSDSDPNTLQDWWTRTQWTEYDQYGGRVSIQYVTAGGGSAGTSTATAVKGVRPAITLKSNNAVDADGTILEGHVPGAPSNLTVSVGTDVQISWDVSADDDNDARYILERSLDDGSTWSVISTQEETEFTEQLQDEWPSITYRVKACDSLSAESEYVTSSAYPLSPVITSVQATGRMMYTGGDTLISISGVHLPDGIQVSLFLGEDSVVSGTTTGSGTLQTATLTVPANSSETDNAIYTVRISLDGGSTWDDTAATVTVQRNSPTVISELSVSPETLSTNGGKITVSVIGTNLYDNIVVIAGPDISGTTTGSETLQTVDLTLPENTSTTDHVTYEIKASLDGGTEWSDVTSASVVKHWEPNSTPEPTSTPATQPTATPAPGSNKPHSSKTRTQEALSIPEDAPDLVIDIPKTGASISLLPFAGFALCLLMLLTAIYFEKSRKKQK